MSIVISSTKISVLCEVRPAYSARPLCKKATRSSMNPRIEAYDPWIRERRSDCGSPVKASMSDKSSRSRSSSAFVFSASDSTLRAPPAPVMVLSVTRYVASSSGPSEKASRSLPRAHARQCLPARRADRCQEDARAILEKLDRGPRETPSSGRTAPDYGRKTWGSAKAEAPRAAIHRGGGPSRHDQRGKRVLADCMVRLPFVKPARTTISR